MTLNINLTHQQGAFTLEASFTSNGRLTALFGPSGSGKTTLINLIGGLIKPQQGKIEVDDRVLVDTQKRILLPPHKRRVGYVFQDARLFPHLSVAQNLRYGRFFTPANERYSDFDAVVELLGISHLLDRKPRLLSGGEKQRVAIGRALITSPRLILMDEPLAALDEARKAEIMPYIERLRDETKIPIVYVSHSISEVARLATDVVALSAGKVIAFGSANDVLAQSDLQSLHDTSESSALIELEMQQTDDGYGLSRLHAHNTDWFLPKTNAAIGQKMRVRIRARDVMLSKTKPDSISALNIVPVQVSSIEPDTSGQALIGLRYGDQKLLSRITQRSVATLELAIGNDVFAIVKTATFSNDNTAAAPL